MQESITKRLETDRKALLDLSLRNPLLSYKISKARGVQVINEQSHIVYDQLVNSAKKLLFADNGKTGEDDTAETFEFSEEELQKGYTDNKLQTAETALRLQKRLLKTYYDANASIQEQGVNILYLTLGMLNWYEADSSEDAKQAPLVLVPVELERQNSGEKFKLHYTKAEVESNLSLQEKLKTDFGVKFPLLADAEYANLDEYYSAIALAVKAKKRWFVSRDSIVLGFFSFGKFQLYQDLDESKWPEGSKPSEHPLMQALLDSGFFDPSPTIGDEVFLDDNERARNMLCVVDADSTQLQAVLAVDEGRNLIIQGPPGTGKSQTITNIIANAIGKGKKVLFVAEKMAALNVVKDRLTWVQLGDACLELHSHKANKKDVLLELKRTLELGQPRLKNLEAEVGQIESYQSELNDYCQAVNEPVGESGMSPFQIMGTLYKQRLDINQSMLKVLHIPDIDQCDAAWLRKATNTARNIEGVLSGMGVPAALPFWGSRVKGLLLQPELDRVEIMIQDAVAAEQQLQQVMDGLSAKTGIPSPTNTAELASWLKLLDIAANAPALGDAQIARTEWLAGQRRIIETIQKGVAVTEMHNQYSESLMPDAWTADHIAIRMEIKAHGRKWWKFLISSYKNAIKILAGWCKGNAPSTYQQRMQLVEKLIDYKANQAGLTDAPGLMQVLFPGSWLGKETDWANLQERAGFLISIHRQISESRLSKNILAILTQLSPAAARKAWNDLERAGSDHNLAIEALLRSINYTTPSSLQAERHFSQLDFSDQRNMLKQWRGMSGSLNDIAKWNTQKEAATEAGFAFLTDESEAWPHALTSLNQSLQKTWLEHYLKLAFSSRKALMQFDEGRHKTLLENFRKGDQLVQQYHRTKTALEHYQKMPASGGSGQVAALALEFNKKARHKPIRKLIEESGAAIQAIKPVFMMSPLSVANYLSPNSISFDLIIFDEASQVKPVDAYGAILRGRQLVVVGDTKQLPPTSFFDKLVMDETLDEDDESYSATSDIPSILNMCNAQRMPERMLRWHYRSRHESLIAVSNYEFYENRLVVFPSPGAVGNLGLRLNYLPGTAYDRGKSRTNKLEAEAVADAVMAHAAQYPDKSLGVVAFSEAQRSMIDDVIDVRKKGRPELEPFFFTTGNEPFFVKNLESVQGDERDVIMISVGYGKDVNGYTTMSFGPLNTDGGEKRLNVLITRAKERCEVFTNLTYDDIDLERAKGAGVKAFKTFLKYAATGILDVPQASGKEADSPFEDAVCQQLEQAGYTVHKQVGSNGFFIDLAVTDDAQPGKYVIGIECDGANYHSARSARDRDLLRQNALEGMGWTFHRIWSTDWFRHADREFKKLVEAIEKAKLSAYSSKTSLKKEQIVVLERKTSELKATTVPKYTTAKLPAGLKKGNDQFHLHAPQKIADWLEAVVRIESPVHIDEVAKRLIEAAGLSKVGSRIKAAILEAVAFAAQSGDIRSKGEFLWRPTMHIPIVRDRSELPASSRKMQFIAPEEISIALITATMNAFAIGEDTLIADCTKMFGFARVTEDMKEIVSKVLEQTLAKGGLIQEGIWIKASQKN